MGKVGTTFSVIVSVVLLSFFTVFAFHPQSDIQYETKQVLDGGSQEFVFSVDANSHMQDVFWLLFVARLVCVAALMWVLTHLSDISPSALRVGGYVLITAPILLAVLPWNTTFTAFHRVFFPQGNWMFPADSLLIQTYPAEFFIQYAIFFGGLLVVSGILLFLISKHYTETNVW